MNKYITLIILSFVAINLIYTKPSTNTSKIDLFIAKKLLYNKKYDRSNYIFNKIILSMDKYDQFLEKTYIYKLILNKQLKNYRYIENNSKLLLTRYIKLKHLHALLYIYATGIYNVEQKQLKKIIKKYRSRTDQKETIDSIVILKTLQNIKYKNKILNEEKKLKIEIKKNKIYTIKDYIKKKTYTSIIERLHEKKIFKIKDKYDYELIFFLIKAYNEMFLTDFSCNLLKYIKENIKS